MNRNEVRRIASGYHYFFVRPNCKENVHGTAEKLMAIWSAREMAIAERYFGFFVKADDDAEDTANRINKSARGTSNVATCHCQYIK